VRKQREHTALLQKLGKGDEVITRGGVIGKITGITDNDTVLVLELQEKVRVRVPRAYIEGRWESKAPESAAKATIKYPDDGKLMGEWKKGEAIAQSGYGGRFSDYPPRRPNGGNCYACHQMTQAEVSYGTVGPTLREYGKIRKYAAEDVKAVYDKIYNAHAAFPCSLMPRLGSNGILSIDQIKDLVALVMSPESPVNK
jgi:sulfur oxidation c-type cytochrome SoxX/preprotein translocase YajC subunit